MKRNNSYGTDLLTQIKENEQRKILEKQKRQLEELKEENRLRQERVLLDSKYRIEDHKRKDEAEKYKIDNERIMNSYMVLSRPKSKLPQISQYKQVKILPKKEDFEINIRNSLQNLQSNFVAGSNQIINEINRLKEHNKNIDSYRNNIVTSISDIKRELNQKRMQEELQKNLLYSSIVESSVKKSQILHLKVDKCVGKVTPSSFMCDWNETFLPIINKVNQRYEEDKFQMGNLLHKNEERLIKLEKLNKLSKV